jgi:Rieske Fe-S protein
MERMGDPTRRGLLEATVLVSSTGFALALGLPGAAFLLSPLFEAEERTWVDLGGVEELRRAGAPLAVRFRYAGRRGYVRGQRPGMLYVVADAAEPEGLLVLSSICSHKGCNVAWSPEEALFACPCHSGRFDARGAPVSGPPKAALERVAVRIEGGHLWAELTETAV